MTPNSGVYKACLFILINLLIGLLIVVLFQKVNFSFKADRSLLVFTAFIALNLVYARTLGLGRELIEFWSIRKMPYLLPAVIAGAFIAYTPSTISLLFGRENRADVVVEGTGSLSSILLTFAIVGWEELWFRGIILNYCERHISPVKIALIIGLLFMLMHALNPDLQLLKKGPALFLAGALLTLVYFYYRSIWVPLGLHYGNNFFGEMLRSKNDTDIFFGGDGYLSAIVLATIFVVYAIRFETRRKKARPVEDGLSKKKSDD